MIMFLGVNSLDLTLFGGSGGVGPIGSPGGSGVQTGPSNLISPTSSSSNQAYSPTPVNQVTPSSTNSPYTNGRPPGSVALPGIHSVAARAAFINAGRSREEAANQLCSPQNVNGKKLPGLTELANVESTGFKTNVSSATSYSVSSNTSNNVRQSYSSDYPTNSVTKSSSVSVSLSSDTIVTRVAVMNSGANRNISSGGNNNVIYSPDPPSKISIPQKSIIHSSTANGSSTMSNSPSIMGVNGVIKLPALNSPLEHQPMHQAMLFGNINSSSDGNHPGNPSVSSGMMMSSQIDTSAINESNGVRTSLALPRMHFRFHLN